MDLDFGKYAPFVVGAFSVTIAVFAWMIWDSLSLARRWRTRFEELDRK